MQGRRQDPLTEHSEPIVERDDHHCSEAGEHWSVHGVTGAELERLAVNVHHHRVAGTRRLPCQTQATPDWESCTYIWYSSREACHLNYITVSMKTIQNGLGGGGLIVPPPSDLRSYER